VSGEGKTRSNSLNSRDGMGNSSREKNPVLIEVSSIYASHSPPRRGESSRQAAPRRSIRPPASVKKQDPTVPETHPPRGGDETGLKRVKTQFL
jgi:hypothetical protein